MQIKNKIISMAKTTRDMLSLSELFDVDKCPSGVYFRSLEFHLIYTLQQTETLATNTIYSLIVFLKRFVPFPLSDFNKMFISLDFFIAKYVNKS